MSRAFMPGGVMYQIARMMPTLDTICGNGNSGERYGRGRSGRRIRNITTDAVTSRYAVPHAQVAASTRCRMLSRLPLISHA